MSASGVVDNTRRKVINYNYNSDTDKIDDEYGHGTHVAGSVLGNCEGSPSSRGMASGAKTSFFDIGNSGSDSLDVSPSIDAIFDSAKYSGAAIHTNSWGTSPLGHESMKGNLCRSANACRRGRECGHQYGRGCAR